MEPAGNGNDAGAIWSAGSQPTPRRPTRPPKDPLLQVTKLTVPSLKDFEAALKGYLTGPPADPDHSQCEIEVWGGAQLVVAITDANGQAVGAKQTMTVAQALIPQPESKETMKRQRAVAKCFIDAIQRVDGFRYAFHNNWKSGDDYRFSYYCNDSLLNKDRVANGKTGSAGKRAYKPVFDCKGVMAIKFSTPRQCVDVVYRHIPLHETYEARAPPPRKDAKRRRDWEMAHPNRVRAPQYFDAGGNPDSTAPEQPAQNVPKEKEKATKSKAKKQKTAANSVESDLRQESMFSLLDLLRTNNEQGAGPPAAGPEQARRTPQQALQLPQPVQAPPRPTPQQPRTTLHQVHPNAKVRHSCAICRNKRLKCDGTRPICSTCRGRSWPCFYTEPAPGDEHNASAESARSGSGPNQRAIDNNGESSLATNGSRAGKEPAPPPPVLFEMASELALLRDKLAEAEERVKLLEAEKSRPVPAQRRAHQTGTTRAQQQQLPQNQQQQQLPQQLAQQQQQLPHQLSQPQKQQHQQHMPVQPQQHQHQQHQHRQAQQQHQQPPTQPQHQQPQHQDQRQAQQHTRQQQQQQQQQQPQQPPQQTQQHQQSRDDRTTHNSGYSTMAYQMAQTTNQNYPTAAPSHTPPQPTYRAPQAQRQPTFTPATQPNYGQQQPQAASTNQQQTTTNMYNQQMRWPAYGFTNLQQQPNTYPNINTRMR